MTGSAFRSCSSFWLWPAEGCRQRTRPSSRFRLVLKEIGIGLVVVRVLTKLAASAIRYCWDKGWVTETWRQDIVVALAFSCFSVAQLLVSILAHGFSANPTISALTAKKQRSRRGA